MATIYLVKKRTLRRLGVWSRNPLTVASGLFTIVGFFATVAIGIFGGNYRTWIFAAIATTLLAVLMAYLAIRRDAAAAREYFIKLSFDELAAEHLNDLMTSIIQGESAIPAFAQIAPAPDELDIILDQLAFTRIARITGGPGEGKSTLAYHAAYAMADVGYVAYSLSGSSLDGLSREYMRDTLLTQTDCLKGKARLLIVDDAHLLERPDDVEEILKRALEDDDTSLIWVRTEDPDDTTRSISSDTGVSIDYYRLAPKLAKFFSEDIHRAGLLKSQPALAEAENLSSAGTIRTAWQFSFVASERSERLANSMRSLTNLQVIVLLVLSARCVATGEVTIPIQRAQSMLSSIAIGWVVDDLRHHSYSYRQVLNELSRRAPARMQFLHLEMVSSTDARISCLHYLFARTIVLESMQRAVVADDFVKALSCIFDVSADDFRYLGMLCFDVGPRLGTLVKSLENFFQGYINSPFTSLAAKARVLQELVRRMTDWRIAVFLERLDGEAMASHISKCSAAEFTTAARFMRYAGTVATLNRRLLAGLDVVAIARTASQAPPAQLGAVAELLREVGERRAELLGELDVPAIARTASQARPEELTSVADLLRELGERRAELLGELDVAAIAQTASRARPEEFGSIADLAALMEAERHGFVELVDIDAMGTRILASTVINPDTLYKLIEILGSRGDQLLQALSRQAVAFGKILMPQGPNRFGDLATIVRRLDAAVVEQLDFLALARVAARCDAKHIPGLSLFVRALKSEAVRFQPLVPWLDLLKRCPINQTTLPGIATCIRSAFIRSETVNRAEELEALQTWVWENRAPLRDAAADIYATGRRYPASTDRSYGHVGQLLAALRDISIPTTDFVVRGTVRSFRRTISDRTIPTARLCYVWRAICDVSPDVAEGLREDEFVRRVLDPCSRKSDLE